MTKTKMTAKSILSMVGLLALVLSMALLGACGSGDQTVTTAGSEATETTAGAESPGKGSAEIIEPSQLISQEEASLIMGEVMDSAETMEQQTIGLKQTFYTSSESGEMLQVTLHQQAFMPEDAPLTPEGLFETIGTGGQQVDGIGDEAWLATPGLHILADGYYIVLAVGNMSVEGNEALLKEGGRIAVDNLRALLK